MTAVMKRLVSLEKIESGLEVCRAFLKEEEITLADPMTSETDRQDALDGRTHCLVAIAELEILKKKLLVQSEGEEP